MKIYTKTGDGGSTGLFAGPRVSKDHPRIEAYGAVDELSAVLGIAISQLSAAVAPEAAAVSLLPLVEELTKAQGDLFSIGAELATPDPVAQGMCLLSQTRITELENLIDRLEESLPPLQSFILPGGCGVASQLHLGRTVCRRAERKVVQLSHDDSVHDCSLLVIYLNRLSDLLFVMARYANLCMGISETPWHRPK